MKKAIEINPQEDLAWHGKGYILILSEQYDNALQLFGKAIQINPERGWAWNNMGITLYKLRMYDDAIKAFNRAIEINPKSARSWHNKANTLYNLGKYEESMRTYNKAMELDPLLYAGVKNNLFEKGYHDKCLEKNISNDIHLFCIGFFNYGKLSAPGDSRMVFPFA